MGNKRQQGAVSLFAVIFAILLLAVLTVSFIKLMSQSQQRATNNDLSQSAYDAALAGVEDAKRVIRSCQEGNAGACTALYSGNNDDCQMIPKARGLGDQPETLIQSSSETNEFDQAYTCVTIAMDTDDYLFSALEGQSELIPLRAAGDIRKIEIYWYNQEDLGVGNIIEKPGLKLDDTSKLPRKDDWGIKAPPMVRTQLITPGANFQLSDLDRGAASQTVFLRPAGLSDKAVNPDFSLDPNINPRPADSENLDNKLSAIICSDKPTQEGYFCKATLDLGRTISQDGTANAFLRVSTIYKGATVRVKLLNDVGGSVMFRGAQPTVDSTGRANSLFRRVQARLRVGDDFPYPSYAVDVANSLCKDFSVGTDIKSGSCTP